MYNKKDFQFQELGEDSNPNMYEEVWFLNVLCEVFKVLLTMVQFDHFLLDLLGRRPR